MRQVLARHLIIKNDVYGKYNRKLQAFTDEGLIEGVVTAADCGGLACGEYKDVMVTLYESFAGTKLVERVKV